MSETTNNRFHITTPGYVFKQHCSTLIDTVQVGYYIESYFRNLQEKQRQAGPHITSSKEIALLVEPVNFENCKNLSSNYSTLQKHHTLPRLSTL